MYPYSRFLDDYEVVLQAVGRHRFKSSLDDLHYVGFVLLPQAQHDNSRRDIWIKRVNICEIQIKRDQNSLLLNARLKKLQIRDSLHSLSCRR